MKNLILLVLTLAAGPNVFADLSPRARHCENYTFWLNEKTNGFVLQYTANESEEINKLPFISEVDLVDESNNRGLLFSRDNENGFVITLINPQDSTKRVIDSIYQVEGKSLKKMKCN